MVIALAALATKPLSGVKPSFTSNASRRFFRSAFSFSSLSTRTASAPCAYALVAGIPASSAPPRHTPASGVNERDPADGFRCFRLMLMFELIAFFGSAQAPVLRDIHLVQRLCH